MTKSLYQSLLLGTLIVIFSCFGEGELQAQNITFAPYIAQATGSYFQFVANGDFDGDGDDDLFGATTFYFDPTNDRRLFVWENQSGVLSAPIKVSYSGFQTDARAVATGDLDGNGDDEIVIAYGDSLCVFDYLFSNWVKVYDAYVGGYIAGSITDAVNLRDLDGDGCIDIAVAGSGFVSILYGSCNNNSFQKINYTINTSYSSQILIEKLSNDSIASLIYMHSGQIDLLKVDNARAATQLTTLYHPYGLPNGIAVGVLNGVRKLASTWGGNQPSCGVVIWDDCSTATFDSIFTLDSPEPIVFAQLDCRVGEEIIVAHGGGDVSVITADTTYNFLTPYASHYQSTALTTGDWNNDGRVDIAVADYNNGLVLLYNTTPNINQSLMILDTIVLTTNYLVDTMSISTVIDTFSSYYIFTTVKDTCVTYISNYQVSIDSINIYCLDTIVVSHNSIYYYNDTTTIFGTMVNIDTVWCNIVTVPVLDSTSFMITHVFVDTTTTVVKDTIEKYIYITMIDSICTYTVDSLFRQKVLSLYEIGCNGDSLLIVSDTLQQWDVQNSFVICGVITTIDTVSWVDVESVIFNSLNLYPNPNNRIFAIDGLPQGESTILVNDILGCEVYSVKTINKNITINLPTVTAGVYFITILNGDRKVTKKMVVE